MGTEKNETSGPGESLNQLRRQLQNESSDALILLSNPDDNPICSISFDQFLPGVVVVWKRYATSTQLRFIHEHILDLLKKYSAAKLLGDDIGLTTIHEEDHDWIVQDWMPRAIAAGLKAGASRHPESHFGKISVAALRSEAPDGLVIRAFDDMTAARRWLADYRV